MKPPAPAIRIGSLRSIAAAIVFPSVASDSARRRVILPESYDVDCVSVGLVGEQPPAIDYDHSSAIAPVKGGEWELSEARPRRGDHDDVRSLEHLVNGRSSQCTVSEFVRRRG